MQKLTIRPETVADFAAIGEVNQLAFGRDDEARLVDALRAGAFTRLSLVAEFAGQIVGHIFFSDLPIVGVDKTVAALALAPIAVLPEFQKRGIGSELVRTGLDRCRADGQRIVMVLGDPHFYSRFGFSAAMTARLQSIYAGEAFMALELTPGALDGVAGRVEYPPPFSELSA
ncbi:MAG: N-acetyltransferase [Planctomycetes bacterium]|nr:N-acetyltransferase [Planctomycetota bacterium]